MIKTLGPVFDVDCAFKADCKGQQPDDPNDLARLIATKLSRCLLLDADGLENLLFHAVKITTKDLQQVGVARLSGGEEMSLSVLLPSIGGMTEIDGKVESRFVILTKPAAKPRGVAIAGFAAWADAREIVTQAIEKGQKKGS